MGNLKEALKTTATVLAVIWALQQFSVTQGITRRALTGQ